MRRGRVRRRKRRRFEGESRENETRHIECMMDCLQTVENAFQQCWLLALISFTPAEKSRIRGNKKIGIEENETIKTERRK
jgi:hypothetical protein